MKTTFRDDSATSPGENGKPALAGAIRASVKILNDFMLRARPIFSWWGGNDNYQEAATAPQVRTMYIGGQLGHPSLSAVVLDVPIVNAAGVPFVDLVNNFTVGGVASEGKSLAQKKNVKENINEHPSIWYPNFATWWGLYRIAARDYAGAKAKEITIQSGSVADSEYGSQLRSGMIVESQGGNSAYGLDGIPLVGTEILPLDGLATGSEIIGDGVLSRDISSLRLAFNRVWRDKRIHFGWSMAHNAGSFGSSITQTVPRYILGTAYGSGGLPISVNSPGISIPLRWAAQGRRTTIRVYVRVYARMAGGGTGSLSVYNRDNSGGMAGPTALTNGPTITGSTFQWYPSGDWAETDPYFNGNANPSYASDRVVLCAQSSGASAVEIAGFTLCVRPYSA